ncbi:hypothetical protein [Mesohalobacter halotolerans]|uniref:Uncharacterized protein n=1 Tax=Mesohalobacter halotolerans TaxID=1883405 RepID=A0A4U5TSG3_9FLAO|nr:hypothetical protein [Mesohalobacter halotolerans]MBS3738350.1 hypothetical protein [Psychroflexus sp.]TKS57257.1 hypothetical protein FCN74_02225 [Mesohalobacter halotolerans]
MKSNRIFLILIIAFVADSAFAQCSMCRAVLESNADNSAAEGINDGIVYLMIFPYLLMGGLGYYIYKTHQKQKKKSKSASS